MTGSGTTRVGVDIGGTKVLGGVVDPDGEVRQNAVYIASSLTERGGSWLAFGAGSPLQFLLAYVLPHGVIELPAFYQDFEGRRSRNGAKMVSNSLAIQTGANPATASISFHWGKAGDGTPAPFFPDRGEEALWFGNGVRVSDPAGRYATTYYQAGADAPWPPGWRRIAGRPCCCWRPAAARTAASRVSAYVQVFPPSKRA